MKNLLTSDYTLDDVQTRFHSIRFSPSPTTSKIFRRFMQNIRITVRNEQSLFAFISPRCSRLLHVPPFAVFADFFFYPSTRSLRFRLSSASYLIKRRQLLHRYRKQDRKSMTGRKRGQGARVTNRGKTGSRCLRVILSSDLFLTS